MTPLFRPEVIDAQRRRLFGSVSLWQPMALKYYTALAVITMALAIGYLTTATYARKETVVGWMAPAGGLSEVRALSPGLIAAVGVQPGDWVKAGQGLVWLDMSATGGSVWNRQVATSGMVLTAPVTGQVVAMSARVGELATNQAALVTISPEGSPLEARLLVPTRAAGMVQAGQDVRLMVDAFPFQRFGAIDGTIQEVARAVTRPGEMAAPVEFKEAVYAVRVRVASSSIAAYGQAHKLESGMTLKADMITDRRTFLTWLLDPLLAAGKRAAG
jgi:multidrug efflux pump subunit AcrA (membrane-fusion protein)